MNLCKDLLYASLDAIALAVSVEELSELCTAKSALYELAVKVLKNVADVYTCFLQHLPKKLFYILH